MSKNHILFVHLSKKKKLALIDKSAVLASFLYPLSGIPQVVSAFQGNVDGISLPSWIGFAVFASFFLYHGILHKVKPMIIANMLWLASDILIIGATILYRFY